MRLNNNQILVVKKPPSELGLRRRHTGFYKLSANERVKAEKSLKLLRLLLWVKLMRPDVGKIDFGLRFFLARHLLLTHTIERGLGDCRPDLKKSIVSWPADECEMDFRFTREQLKILVEESAFLALWLS